MKTFSKSSKMFFALIALSNIFIPSTLSMITTSQKNASSTQSLISSPPKNKNSSLSCLLPVGFCILDLFSCKQKRESKALDIFISRTINNKFTFLFGLDPHESPDTVEESELQLYRAQTITHAMKSLKQSFFESDQERDAMVKVKIEQTLKELIGAHAAELYTIYYSQEADTNDAALKMAEEIRCKVEQEVSTAIDASKEGALIRFLGQKLENKVKAIAQKNKP